MDQLQQLLKGLTDSWGVLWAVRGMKRQNRAAGGHIYFSTLMLGPTGRRSGPKKISKLFQN
jgi:hypothetical protein